MGNSFGEIFRVTTFGESHGEAIGAVVDGCPAGLALAPADFLEDMGRRRPGFSEFASARREEDEVRILSGVFQGLTLGTPIALLIENRDARSQDYENLGFRQGHGDAVYMEKYGIWDYRGGGRASGRETAARVAAGVIAKKILRELEIEILAEAAEIDYDELKRAMAEGDSLGSTVICTIRGLKAGIGQPVFNKLEADLAKAIMSIGGARAVEFAQGRKAAKMRATEHNELDKGILAGISDGNDIHIKTSFKPPPTIKKGGRHDPILAPRACPIIEAMAAITLTNHIFLSFSNKIKTIKAAYKTALRG
ncbi:MAG: chorismate synthase [Clostridiales bacterium]|jgi:chorismate synthase|nr:chorismate synthase [Clostridiales bacterium]